MSSNEGQETQLKLLNEASTSVKQTAFHMKRSMDQHNMTLVLKYASDMLRELRTSLLTPKNYYQLYMQVCEELRELENYFQEYITKYANTQITIDDVKQPTLSIRELYEKVQCCGNALPRLYLLITVGSVYIKTKDAPAKEILTDLVEMTKGVQFPMRGLFLRNYLSFITKDKLPDTGSEYEGKGGHVEDAIDFLIQNFSETNRLWIRMQHQLGNRDKKLSEKERQDLKILVGTGLVRLSQLEGINLEIYSVNVLPRILKIVKSCKDKLAQEYLMDCIIQVFPDEFHISTIQSFVDACKELHEQVNIRVILVAYMDRLSNYGVDHSSDDFTMGQSIYEMLFDAIVHIVSTRKDKVTTDNSVSLFTGLIKFSFKCYSEDVAKEQIQKTIEQVYALVSSVASSTSAETSWADVVLYDMFMFLFGRYHLRMLDFVPVLSFFFEGDSLKTSILSASLQKRLTLSFLRMLFTTENTNGMSTIGAKKLGSPKRVGEFFQMLTIHMKDTPLLSDETGDEFNDDFETAQNLIAKSVHLLEHENPHELFKMFGVARKHFGQGGIKRIRFTLIPLVFRALDLAKTLHEKELEENRLEITPRKVLQFVHEIVTALASNYSFVSLQLFLQCALVADYCRFEAIAYEFFTQAFILYEDEISDSKLQISALNCMIGVLLKCKHILEENYDILATKTTQYAAKLLKKSDQCHMILKCSLLFWITRECKESNYHRGSRVLECLQRSLKIADSCVNSSSNEITLFVDVLDHYLYFFERKTPEITAHYLSGLIALIKEHLQNMDDSNTYKLQVENHFQNSLSYIQMQGHVFHG